MNNFKSLDHYILPSSLLLKITKLYENIGLQKSLELEIEEELKKKLFDKTLILDAYNLSTMLNLNISDSRKKQLLEKNNEPKNKEEKILINLKNTLKIINKDVINFKLNASELINYVNMIYNDKIKYNETEFNEVENKIKHSYSVRFLINKEFDDYDEYLNNNLYEKTILTSIILSDIFNLSPLSKHNDAALLIAVYYLLRQIKINIVNFESFFESMLKHYDMFLKSFNEGLINYQNGFLNPTKISENIIDSLNELFDQFAELVKDVKNKKNGNKQILIEQTILKLPSIFTKDDIRLYHPEASDTTIQRALNHLKNENIIMPLGTGRNARWRKNIENLNEIDISKLFGE